MGKNNNISTNEKGMVAIIVTVFFMIVLSLIVLAFSQTARREQRQSLDNQLQKQAFYAAESGINDTARKIASNEAPYNLDKKSDCNDLSDKVFLTSDQSVSYSCVLFEKNLDSITNDNLDQEGETYPLKTTTTNPNKLELTWSPTQAGGTDTSGCPDNALPATLSEFVSPSVASCNPAILRVTFLPYDTPVANRDELINEMYTVFLRPVKSGGASTVQYQSYNSAPNSTQGNIVGVNCNGTNCKITITDLPNKLSYLNVRTIDKATAISIAGFDTTNAKLLFSNAQIKIDVTGKATDVIRRLQVRKKAEEMTYTPPYVLQIMDGICKRLSVDLNNANNDDCGGIN